MTVATRNAPRYALVIVSFVVVSYGIYVWIPFGKLHAYLAYFFLPAFLVSDLLGASFWIGGILSFVYIALLFLPTGLAFHLGPRGPRRRLLWVQVLVMILHSLASMVFYSWMMSGEP